MPVWKLLAADPNIDLTVFHGAGSGSGSSSEASRVNGLNVVRLFTIPTVNRRKYRVLHPFLVSSVLSRSYDVVLCEGTTYFPNSLFLAMCCKLINTPFLLYEAPPLGTESFIRKVSSPFYRKCVSGLITYNSWGAEYFLTKGYSKNYIHIAQNTIDTTGVIRRLKAFSEESKSIRAHLGMNNTFVIGYIGALEKRKRVDVVIASTIRLLEEGYQVSALLVGDGPAKASLQGIVPAKYHNKVVFTGRRVDDAEKYLQLCSVVILPSEGGLAVPHALTCGVPCIATEDAEGPGIRDYIIHGVNGFIVEAHSVLEDSVRILRKMLTDSDYCKDVAYNARASYKRFSVEKMVSAIINAAEITHERMKS